MKTRSLADPLSTSTPSRACRPVSWSSGSAVSVTRGWNRSVLRLLSQSTASDERRYFGVIEARAAHEGMIGPLAPPRCHRPETQASGTSVQSGRNARATLCGSASQRQRRSVSLRGGTRRTRPSGKRPSRGTAVCRQSAGAVGDLPAPPCRCARDRSKRRVEPDRDGVIGAPAGRRWRSSATTRVRPQRWRYTSARWSMRTTLTVLASSSTR